MSVLSVIALIALIIGVFVLAGSLLAKDHDAKLGGRLVGVGILIIAGLCTLLASITSVPARSVGVVISFGKPVAALDSGLHWKRPWQVVRDMDGSTQIDDNLGDRKTDIRLGNQANAFVQNSLRWKIKTEAAGNLYADYRTFERIAPGLVEQELAAALNFAFSDYDPLAAVKAEAEAENPQTTEPTPAKSYDDVANAVKARLTERIGDRIIVESVIIPKVDFDDATQARINAYQAEIGNTRIAVQREKTAAAEARANGKLAASVSKDPNVIVSKCEDSRRLMIEKGQPVPAGFSCWPGSNSTVIAAPK